MKVLLTTFVFFCCIYIHAKDFFSQEISDVAPEVIATGKFMVAGRLIEINPNDNNNIFSITVNNIVYTLREYHFISQVKYSSDRKKMILKVMKWNPKYSGAAYQSVIVVYSTGDEGKLIIKECLSSEYLKSIDGHDRFVKTIGNLDEFPLIELELGYHVNQGYPTDVGYEWTKWDISSRLPLSGLSPSGAISR